MLFIIAILAAVAAGFVYLNAKKRSNKAESAYALIGLALALVIAVFQCWTIIPAGSRWCYRFFWYRE